MIAVNEKLDLEVCVTDFDEKNTDDLGPMIVLCEGIDINELKVLKRLEQLYHTNQVNRVFRRLNRKNYFSAETKGHRHTLFGIKCCKDGICRILESHEKDACAIVESVVQFLSSETESELLEARASAL